MFRKHHMLLFNGHGAAVRGQEGRGDAVLGKAMRSTDLKKCDFAFTRRCRIRSRIVDAGKV